MRASYLTAGVIVLVMALALWRAAPFTPPPRGEAQGEVVVVPQRDQPRPKLRSGNEGERIVESLRAVPRASSVPAPLPVALRDTDNDGALPVDGDGRLIVTRDLRRFFDYFLISGDESPDVVRTRIVGAITARLSPPADAETISLLDRYLAYRNRVRELASTGEIPDGLGDRFERLRAIRREVLGEQDAEALFGAEEADLFVALAQHDVTRDPAMSADERERAADALEAQLPEEARVAREEATAPLRLAREEQALRDAGGDAADVRALRERYFGADAADRLEALDHQRAEWQSRIDSYRAARAAVEADSSLSTEERIQAIDALLAERFTVNEQLRVRALDQLSGVPLSAMRR